MAILWMSLVALLLTGGDAFAQGVAIIGTDTPVNYTPVADPSDVSTPAGTSVNLQLSGNDANGDPITFIIVSGPANGSLISFDGTTGAAVYAPATGFVGTDSFMFKTNDGIADSAPAVVTITVKQVFTLTARTNGGGMITSTRSGIDCGRSCQSSYLSGTAVTLTAVSAPGFFLSRWTGCNAVAGTTCTVTVNSARSVTATFAKQGMLRLIVGTLGRGAGAVVSDVAGINCGRNCMANVLSGTTVTLTASPATGSHFVRWIGCPSISGSVCTVRMVKATAIRAMFSR